MRDRRLVGDFIIDSLAWVTFAAGLVFRFWPTLYVGGRKRVTLVCQGPYSVCRNPLYLGSLLLAASLGLFLQSLVFAIFLAVVVFVYASSTIPAEEHELHALLGEPYDEYCRRVPRFWPNFSLFRTADTIEVKVKGLRIEAKRAALWIFLPVLGELVSELHSQPWWPHWLNLF